MKWYIIKLVSKFSPVNGNIILDMVGNFDEYRVVFPGIEGWPREPTVNGYDWLGGA